MRLQHLKRLIMLAGLFTAALTHGQDISMLSYTNVSGVISITDCTQNYAGEVNIPGSIGGRPVTAIGARAFLSCRNLRKVTLPDSIVSIGGDAFEDCIGLTNIFLGDGLERIGNDAFEGCESLTEVMLPPNTSTIGHGAFDSCSNLESIGVEEGNQSFASVGGVLFDADFTRIIRYPIGKIEAAYNIPEGITDIYRAFTDCNRLEEVTIPDTVTEIGHWAFAGCSRLETIIIPDTVTYIYPGAFAACSDLMSVTLPESLQVIRDEAFANCSSLSSVTIPYSVEWIGEAAFVGCTNMTQILVDATNAYYTSLQGVLYDKELTALLQCPAGKVGSVTIPASLVFTSGGDFYPPSISDKAFHQCKAIENIYVEEGNPDYFSVDGVLYQNDAFFDEGMTALIKCPAGKSGSFSVPNGVNYIFDAAFAYCDRLTSITLPNSLSGILDDSFMGCDGVTNLSLPSNLEYFGVGAVRLCNNLRSINVDVGNTNYVSIDGVLYNGDASTLVQYPPGKDDGLFIMPESVTYIDHSAFEGCVQLSSVSFSDNLDYIGPNAFEGCDGLLSLNLPDSISEIDRYAFSSCSNLGSVTFGSSTLELEVGCFRNCENLTNATFFGDAPSLWYLSFNPPPFIYVEPNFTVYFVEGSSGFTRPTWNGYPCKMLIPEFDEWVLGLPEGQRGPADCPDGDGIPNLMKYVAGLRTGGPHATSDLFFSSLQHSPSNALLTMTFYKDPDVQNASLGPIASTNVTGGAEGWATDEISISNTGTFDENGREIWTATLPCEDGAGFMRLEADFVP